jgi:hypothetical protein
MENRYAVPNPKSREKAVYAQQDSAAVIDMVPSLGPREFDIANPRIPDRGIFL